MPARRPAADRRRRARRRRLQARRQAEPRRATPAPRAPRSSAAVAAMFACAQSAAATLTVRQRCAPARRCAGSIMWCIVWPRVAPAAHGRARRREPSRARSRSSAPGRVGSLRWSSVTLIAQPPGGAGPAVAMSPPRLTSTPQPLAGERGARAARSAAHALAVAPRSRRTPRGTRTVERARVELDASASRCARAR